MKSMTGFGRAEVVEEDRKYTVELKSVNHRYLDLSVRLPRKLNQFENSIRNIVKEYAVRGKADLSINYENVGQGQSTVKYNEELAGEYLAYLGQISEAFHLDNDIRVSTLSRYPEVLSMEEAEENVDDLWNGLERAVRSACEQFVQARIKEGTNLKKDILGKLDMLTQEVTEVEKRSPEIVTAYRSKLEEKLKDLLDNNQIDEGRIAAEVIVFADKICTDEETVRLKSHITHMRDTLESQGDIGKKLDFLAQEMNREANTILSKANDMETSNHAIELKTGIEKIREQIQNIE